MLEFVDSTVLGMLVDFAVSQRRELHQSLLDIIRTTVHKPVLVLTARTMTKQYHSVH